MAKKFGKAPQNICNGMTYPLFQGIPAAQSDGNVQKDQTKASEHDLKVTLHSLVYAIFIAT